MSDRHKLFFGDFSLQWHIPTFIFLLYRFVVAAYILTWLFLTMRDQQSSVIPYGWAAYLTNWSYLVLATHLLLAFVIAILHTPGRWGFCQKTSVSQFTETYPPLTYSEEGPTHHGDDIPWFIKLDWVLFNIIACFAFIVTAIYWGALYPYMDLKVPPITDINLHAVNSIVIVLEFILSAIPVRLLHGVYPFIYGICYMVFSIIFWAVDHDHIIYPHVLDWNQVGPTVAVVLVLGFIIIPLLQLFLWAMFRVKQLLYTKICLSQ